MKQQVGQHGLSEREVSDGTRFWAAGLGIVLVVAAQAMADEAPKYGGTLTYIIPADSPPSFDAQREETYATIHSAAPFYSVLIGINPSNPEGPERVWHDTARPHLFQLSQS